jgi:hypothetical protein
MDENKLDKLLFFVENNNKLLNEINEKLDKMSNGYSY